MELLIPFSRRPLHNGEVITLYTRTLEIVPATGLSAAVLTARSVLSSYVQDMSGEHVAQGSSPLTQQAQELEAARDEQFSSIVFFCRACSQQRHNAALRGSAEAVLACIGKFGNITEFTMQPDADESADISSLLRDIDESSELTAHVAAMGATGFFTELGRLNTEFERVSLARTAERSTRAGKPSLEDLRTLADKAFSTLCRKINSHADSDEGADPWPELLDKLNTLFRETRTQLKARKTRAQNEAKPNA